MPANNLRGGAKRVLPSCADYQLSTTKDAHGFIRDARKGRQRKDRAELGAGGIACSGFGRLSTAA